MAGKAVTRIVCVGAGYVGGSTMPIVAEHCSDITVTVVDLNKERIDAWNSSSLPIYEPDLQPIVEAYRGKNLFFTTDTNTEIQKADLIFIAVNTGTKEYGFGAGSAYDLGAWESVARGIAKSANLSKTYVIVEKSTVPVKTAEKVKEILEACKVNPETHYEVISNPEFLAEGTAVLNLEKPDRVLIGGLQTETGKDAVARLASVYAHWVPQERIITTNLWSSELSKLAANAFLSQRISSVNSLSAICEATGADIEEVAHVIGKDDRVGSRFLKTSVGWGGSCFKKDLLGLIYLCETCHLPEVAEYWRQVIAMNEYQKERFCRRIVQQMFGTITRKKILLLGFAFKKNTGDTRESAAIDICKFLTAERADLHVYDPKVPHDEIKGMFPMVTCTDDPIKTAEGAHAIVVATEWDEFVGYDYEAIHKNMLKPAFLFDGRNILDHTKLSKIGFHVYAVGQRSVHEINL
eukprot:TRINITY_DN484_c0_g1_i1.p1 TRINITY_DN484_c0_g1~~TRINITY_DN484_c0_g1_i1.p1  ORF type:complete len:464 (-),score=124.87 TRINITY_DN484_c0_g1_i1:55-1446(-)